MTTKRHAEQALARRMPGPLDQDARAAVLRSVVVSTVTDEALGPALDDIEGGDGGELTSTTLPGGRLRAPKLHSAYSSCGLALNTFAPWRVAPSSLRVACRSGYTELRFEHPLRIFRGGRAPNLDVVATAADHVLGIESKLTEHLAKKKPPTFSDAYDRLEATTDPTWWAVYRGLKAGTLAPFDHLDVGQLVKHAFGLRAHCGKHSRSEAVLLYLYWEPQDPTSYAELRLHAAEVQRFAAAVSGSTTVVFEAMTYAELWRSWEAQPSPSWLCDHVKALRGRYDLPLA